MGAYSERDYIVRQQMKRDTIETAIKLFGWKVMYQTLRDKGVGMVLSWESPYNDGHKQMCTLRYDHPPTTPGWKLAVYDLLFKEEP